jgi:hypothetical protein
MAFSSSGLPSTVAKESEGDNDKRECLCTSGIETTYHDSFQVNQVQFAVRPGLSD